MDDLWAALALVLVIEGILPMISPASWKNTMRQAADLSDRTLRLIGAGSMIAGAVLLQFVR